MIQYLLVSITEASSFFGWLISVFDIVSVQRDCSAVVHSCVRINAKPPHCGWTQSCWFRVENEESAACHLPGVYCVMCCERQSEELKELHMRLKGRNPNSFICSMLGCSWVLSLSSEQVHLELSCFIVWMNKEVVYVATYLRDLFLVERMKKILQCRPILASLLN